MQEQLIVGVDVSKGSLDYMWLPGGKASSSPNTSRGILALVKKLSLLQPTLVVMEATGGYQNALELALFEANIPCAVVNPRQVRDFAKSLNRLGKTDKLDALTLTEFGQSRKLSAKPPKPVDYVNISFLLSRREQLQGMITGERNHLEHAPLHYKQGIENLLSTLSLELRKVDRQIKELIQANSELSRQDELLQSIPGVGPVASATVLTGVPELREVGRKQASALVGVAPFNRDSGKYRGQRHIFAGRSSVRRILYCIMRPCLQFNTVIRSWFEHFISAGKPYKVAVIACVRKLLIVMRAMLISQKPWDESLHCRA